MARSRYDTPLVHEGCNFEKCQISTQQCVRCPLTYFNINQRLQYLDGRDWIPFQDILNFFFFLALISFIFWLGLWICWWGKKNRAFCLGQSCQFPALVSRRGLHLTHFIIHVPILLYGTGFSLLQYLAKILKSAGMPGKVLSKECAIKTPSVCTHWLGACLSWRRD
jgi:hypothetical protein